MKKKLLSLLLIAALMLSLFPSALAESITLVDVEEEPTAEEDLISLVEPSPAAVDELKRLPAVSRGTVRADSVNASSGQCGESLTWKLDGSTLTVSGSGTMYTYDWGSMPPWYNDRDSITKVVVKSGVTGIGMYAFNDCRNLTSVSLPDSLVYIDPYAFSYCFALSSLTLPANLEFIGTFAFEGAPIRTITIPAATDYIGSAAFAACTSLTEIKVASGNASFKSVDGVLLTKDGETLLCYPSGKTASSYTIPASVTMVGDQAFWAALSLTKVTIPANVQTLGFGAFTSCYNMTQLSLAQGLTTMNAYCFQGSDALTTVTIPASVLAIYTAPFNTCDSLTEIKVASGNGYYKSEDGVLLTKDGTELIQCPAGKPERVYRVPDGVQDIWYDAFWDNRILSQLSIPDSVTSIQEYAFGLCRALLSVTFEGSAPSIGATGVFMNVTATVYYPDGDPTWTEEVRQDYDGDLTWVAVSGTPGPALKTPRLSTEGVGLRWDAANAGSAGTSYELQRRVGEGDWGVLATVTDTSYTDANVKMAQTYHYRVRAKVNGSWSGAGEELEVFFNPFSDVSGKKTIEYIAWAYNNDIVKGTSTTTFRPNNPCTRIQFIMMLWKMNGSPEVGGTNPFADISGSKTVKAILWALDAGVVNAGKNFFPDENISRVQIVMILWKMTGSPEVSGTNPFTDVSGSKTIKAVLWAYKNGITKGRSSDPTKFDPDKDCTRDQLVTFLYKYNAIYPVHNTTYRALLVGEVHFSWETATRNEGDVKEIAAMLAEAEGPEGGKYTVTPKYDLSRSDIKKAIASAFADADNDDVSLFFIATHGVVDVAAGPYAGEVLTIESPGVTDGYLTLGDLADWLKAVPGKVIVVLGSCGSGAAIVNRGGDLCFVPNDTGEADAVFSEAVIQAFAEADEVSNTGEFRSSKFYVLTAAAHQESSWGSEYLHYNFFPHYFAVGASSGKPADADKDGLITLDEMYRYCYKMALGPYNGSYYQHAQVYPENSSYPLFK